MRLARVPLLMSALLIPALTLTTVPDRAEAKGLKSFVAKAAVRGAVRSLRKNGDKPENEAAAGERVESAFPAQVNATVEPVVAVAAPKPVGPPNTGLVCVAGCYDGNGRSVAAR